MNRRSVFAAIAAFVFSCLGRKKVPKSLDGSDIQYVSDWRVVTSFHVVKEHRRFRLHGSCELVKDGRCFQRFHGSCHHEDFPKLAIAINGTEVRRIFVFREDDSKKVSFTIERWC